jgi:hypothetical protein
MGELPWSGGGLLVGGDGVVVDGASGAHPVGDDEDFGGFVDPTTVPRPSRPSAATGIRVAMISPDRARFWIMIVRLRRP